VSELGESMTSTTATPAWWFKLLCLGPLLFLLCVYLEAGLASFILGHWPVPSLEDPKDLPTASLHWFGTALFLSLPAGVVMLAAVMGWKGRKHEERSHHWWWLGVLAISWIAMHVVVNADMRTWSWWFD
jgi:hypothetical protein